MSDSNPAIVRTYLDAKRGLKRPMGRTGNIGSVPVKLTSDVMYFAHTAGSLYRVPERISAEDLLHAMRRLERNDGGDAKTTKAVGVEGAESITVDDVRAFIAEWDSASYLHRDAGLHVLDFSLFLRFASSESDAQTAGRCTVYTPSQATIHKKHASRLLQKPSSVWSLSFFNRF